MECNRMIALMALAVIGFLAWLTVRAMNRDKASRNRVDAIRAAVRQAHGIEDVFVSPEDGSFVGLSGDGARIVLGKGEEGHSAPVTAIRAIEGVRDGAVLIRAEPDGDPVTPAADQDVTDLPERIRTLELRVTLDEQAHTVLFFEGGRHGVTPDNAPFRQQAALAEVWFRKISTAMRLAR
jgi:hypothetical protein